MNMISTGSFLTETSASNKQSELVKTLTAAWEKKNSKAARAGGVSLMALSLAACGSSDDTTPFSQADVDTAVAAVDITTDNAAAMTSNDAEIAAAAKTAALTATNGTIYATVDAAYDAGSLTSNADAVTAALTATGGTVYATVDAAVAAGAAGVDITTDNAAAISATLTGTNFATVADLIAAYNAATASAPVLNSALTSSAETVNGTVGNDTITATGSTYNSGDLIVDATATDNDTLTVTATNDVTATATVAGIENIVFNLDSVSAAAANADAFDVNVANIANGTVTVAVTKAGSPIAKANLTNVGTGVGVRSDLATLTVAGDADGDHTITLTGSSTQTLTQTGATDTLVVNAGSLSVTDLNAEEQITIAATGSVSITDITPNTTTLNDLDITAGGAITISDLQSGGHVDASTTSGNVTVATASKADVAGDNLTASTGAGNVTVTNWTGTGTVTAVASGNISNASTTDDGDVTITQTDATVVSVTASGDANIDDIAEATTLTLNVGQDSNVANTNDNIQFLTVSSTSASENATIIEFADGDGTINGTADGMVELDTITFTGSNSVTVDLSGADLVLAAASTANSTSAAKLIATDTMTGGTSRIAITASAGANTLDISGLAVDEVAIGYTLNAGEAFTVRSGQNIVITGDTTADLAISAGAVAGQTASIVFANDGAATTANDLGGITASNLATVTVSSLDMAHSGAAAGAATGAVNVGAANTLAITGAGKINVASITGAILDGSQATGKITVGTLNGTTVFKGGAAGDSFTSGGDTDLNVDGNGGTDTLVLAAQDYSDNTVTLSDIEVIDVSASGVTLAGSTLHNSTYVISADNGTTDTLAVNATVATGEIINISGVSSAAKVTMTGSNGADALTGSATTGTFFVGGTGSDTIVGGAGVDNVTVTFETSAADTITLGGGNDVVTNATTTAATISEFTVTDMNLGTALTAADTFAFSITALNGLTTVTAMTDTGDVNSANTDGTVVHLSADGATVTDADLVVLQNTYANEAAVLAGLKTAGGDTITYSGTLDDNDAFLVAYTDGTNSYIAVATTGAGDLTTSEGIDSVENIMVLAGITDLTNLDSTDFAYVA